MITYIVGGIAVLFYLGSMLWMFRKYREMLSIKNTLIKQNLVYLISFTNYFDWITNHFKTNADQILASDPELQEFLKKAGMGYKSLSEKLERPITSITNQVIGKGAECLEDIKKPLEREITQALDMLKDGYV